MSDRILRVFARRTKACPWDAHVRFDAPGIFDTPIYIQEYAEIHVSVTFTWDIVRAWYLRDAWQRVHSRVLIGGPALGDSGNNFVSGRYLRKGITITSRGCPNHCPWCIVPEREGKIRLIEDFPEGHEVQDNNLTACPRSHLRRVFEMLLKQRRAARFTGGLRADRLGTWWIDKLRSLRINEIWVAADTDGGADAVAAVIRKLRRFLSRRQVRCYCLAGFEGTIESTRARCEMMWDAGAMPFVQLYQDFDDRPRTWSSGWKALAREWSRPAAMAANHVK